MLGRAWGMTKGFGNILRNDVNAVGRAYGAGAGAIERGSGLMEGFNRADSLLQRDIGTRLFGYGATATGGAMGGAAGFATGDGLADRIGRGVMGAGMGVAGGIGAYRGAKASGALNKSIRQQGAGAMARRIGKFSKLKTNRAINSMGNSLGTLDFS